MTNSKHISLTLMLMMVLLRFATAQAAAPQQTALSVGSAVVREIKGEVVFNSPQGSPIVAQRGSTLTAENSIETAKGTVLLELEDGSQVLVKPHSNVVLKTPDRDKGYFLELLIGKILVKAQKRLGLAPSFRMGTPSAVITVRGTRFLVEVDKKRKTFVDVFEGVVEVMGLAESSPHVLITPGFSTRVDRDRGPEEPRETLPGEGSGRDGGRDGEGSGPGRSLEDQRNQPRETPSNRGPEGKSD